MIAAQKKWILIFLAAALLFGALFLVLSLTVWKDVEDDTSETFMTSPVALADIAEISVKNAASSYRLYRAQDGELYFEGAEYVLYNQNRIAFLRSCVANLSVSGEVEKPEALTEYCLTDDTCLADVTVRSNAGDSYRFFVGSALYGDEGYYARLSDSEQVFVLDTSLKNCLFGDVTFFLSAQVAPMMTSSDAYEITDLKIEKAGALYVEVQKVPEEEKSESDLSTHRLIYPAVYEPNAALLTDIFKSFSSFVGTEVCEFGMSEKPAEQFRADMESYGFLAADGANMNCKVSYTASDGTLTELYVSTPDAQSGNSYIYSPGFDIIASFSSDSLVWTEYDLMQYAQIELFARSIGDVQSISVKGEDVDATFTLTHGQAASDLVVKEGSNIITTAYFRQFYNQILDIDNLGYADIPSDLSQFSTLSLTITLSDGAVFDYVFYDISSRQSYYTVGGEGVFYVNRDYVKKLASDAVLLKSNEAVEAREYA